jgi:cell division protein FtsB
MAKRSPESKDSKQKTRKVPVSLPTMESASEHWLRNIRMSGLAFTVLALIVLSLVVLAPSLRTVVKQQQQISALNESVKQQKDKVASLTGDVARWSDPAYVEAQARQRLYYVYPGEHPYLVIDDGKTSTKDTTTPISTKIQTTKVDWAGSLLQSIVTAGTTDATPATLDGTNPDGTAK